MPALHEHAAQAHAELVSLDNVQLQRQLRGTRCHVIGGQDKITQLQGLLLAVHGLGGIVHHDIIIFVRGRIGHGHADRLVWPTVRKTPGTPPGAAKGLGIKEGVALLLIIPDNDIPIISVPRHLHQRYLGADRPGIRR